MKLRWLMVWFMSMEHQMPTARSISQAIMSIPHHMICASSPLHSSFFTFSNDLHKSNQLWLTGQSFYLIVSLFSLSGCFLCVSLFLSLILSIVKTGDTSQHEDILFLYWHSQRDGIMDESDDRCCACARRASHKVCKSIIKIVIFPESLSFYLKSGDLSGLF